MTGVFSHEARVSRCLLGLICFIYLLPRSNAAYPVVFDDSEGVSRQFEGIGGISGGGATSKLLVNYPQKQRDEILDYLFKPSFGASLHILKVEIGGDMQSTDGSEASHMHNSWEENYQRGYEWWLMKEAKKRNPDIKLYALPWGFPAWIGKGTHSPYVDVNMTADYVVRFINGAKVHHNLTFDYVGIWNEREYNITYIKTLREMMDARGFKYIKIIAPDDTWHIAKDIQADPELAKIVHGIGCHYPGTNSSSQAKETGKALWASEDYSTYNDETGGGCWARILNQNYVNGLMTSTISWNLIGSYYNGLPFFSDGLMTAVEPWSGYYEVKTPIWISAHTTQFVPIGWHYMKHGSGVGKLKKGGSYVAFASPSKKDLTIVIETMTHDHSKCIRPPLPKYDVEPQTIIVTLKGSFASVQQMNVWYSKLGFDGEKSTMFVKKDPITFTNGKAQLSIGLDEVYTLTTVSGGRKGAFGAPPISKPFPLPYTDDFEDTAINQEPVNLAPQIGSMEVVKSSNASHGKVARQTVLEAPLQWCKFPSRFPNAIIGDFNWSEIFIEVEFKVSEVNGTNGVFIAGRVTKGGCHDFEAQGIFFYYFDRQFVVTNDIARTKVLKYNDRPPPIAGWHKLSLLITNETVTGAFDGKRLFDFKTPKEPTNGWVAIGQDKFGLVDFDNFRIANKADGIAIMNSYSKSDDFQSHPLYFEEELRLN